MPKPTTHHQHFAHLDRLLAANTDLWQVRAFHHRTLGLQQTRPDFAAALKNLRDAEIGVLEQNPGALENWLAPWLGDTLSELKELTRLDPLPARARAIPPRFATGIGGRKWAQIRDLAAVLPNEPAPLLEWCSGKGHLGRLLALTDGREVVSLERDQHLCAAGSILAQQASVPQTFALADALDHSSAQWLPPSGQAVALHACGDLHTQLIRHWVDSSSQRLTLSPCCYHLIGEEHYTPISQAAQNSALRLNKIDLQWTVRERVTGGQAVERQRQTERWWRLAFDEWQRALRGEDTYLPLAGFPKKLLSGSFQVFCRWAAESKQLPVPNRLDEAHWLEQGRQRIRTVRLAELVGRPFQRALELWLVLDRVQFLEEYNAQVTIGTFCDREMTPRNIVIDAQR